MYNANMTQRKNTKHRKEREKNESMKIILTDTNGDTAEQEEEDGDEEMGGIFWDKADMKLLYHALMHYKPTEGEKQLREILCEEFEETLVCDYGEKLPERK
jgi:hypothetical protein